VKGNPSQVRENQTRMEEKGKKPGKTQKSDRKSHRGTGNY